jgi:hypothetical protein
MTVSASSPLFLEWRTLQQDHERHERGASGLKFAAVALTAFAVSSGIPLELAAVLNLVVWGCEAMLRTVQARLGARLLKVEALIAEGAPERSACQLHTAWQASRSGVAGLLQEYAVSALKPTVAFPHALLSLLPIALALAA